MSKSYNCWLHRVSHEGGYEILKKEKKLTIGFSKVAHDNDALASIENCDKDAFCNAYAKVYNGGIPRSKNGLWRFVAEMQVGDRVVVPYPTGFCVCEITGRPEVCNRPDLDLGWEMPVEFLADGCSPRSDYAKAPLLSRMKCFQVNLFINDLKDYVDEAIGRKRDKKPIFLYGDVAKCILGKLKDSGEPEAFEEVVAAYFRALGAETLIMPKNFTGKEGDCDVEAVFQALHCTVSVQCKRHVGETDDWAVRQIAGYASKRNPAANWTYANWVVSLGDGFTDEAEKLARENNVVLVNGMEFCKLLLSAGWRM